MERSEIRERRTSFSFVPDFASLHPGYGSSDPIVMKPVTTTGFI
jgi:hypothetical protein